MARKRALKGLSSHSFFLDRTRLVRVKEPHEMKEKCAIFRFISFFIKSRVPPAARFKKREQTLG
ncbi:MAG: hypothetical protein D3914_15160 [Candidatus Electrothrix sp. LOE2]|nr:hypothetical protein [Candidatus Electrothrix sp. LOE2]